MNEQMAFEFGAHLSGSDTQHSQVPHSVGRAGKGAQKDSSGTRSAAGRTAASFTTHSAAAEREEHTASKEPAESKHPSDEERSAGSRLRDVNGAAILWRNIGKRIGTPKANYDLVIATDGSCSGNPGPGGWAWVEQLSGISASGGARTTTNNIMELTAMIEALTYAGSEAALLIRADSSYVINSMTKWAPNWRRKGWRKADGKPVQNKELIETLLNLYEARTGKTDIEWVRGHNGDAGNELADTIAVEQTRRHAL
ncbi:MAG: ribonuclease HI [Actinomycetaceae bacterium]|nr:ribonuclease HI [Arcanobacterium sp.]MDD7505683.1 ribonuclease HI [Actinomycetaceae bacterium]MDY6143468.1 ribonuclease H [Arcanobacterium sp.]